MPVRVKPITLWRTEVEHRQGELARTLEPLAAVRANLQAVMGYRLPGDRARAAIEIFPVAGARTLAAAQAAGLREAPISAIAVEGDDRPGLGHALAKALADAGINLDFFVGLATGGRHATVIGFETREDADRALPLIKRAAAAPRTPARRRGAGKARRGAVGRRARRTRRGR
jgi:hypothetical protein